MRRPKVKDRAISKRYSKTLSILLTRLKGNQGAALVEFAIIAPLLTTLLFAALDFGKIANTQLRLNNALEAGAIYAFKYSYNTSGITSAITNATTLTGITSTIGQYCACADASRPTCGTTCADGSKLATYITIVVSSSVPTTFTYLNKANPYLASSKVIVRVQ